MLDVRYSPSSRKRGFSGKALARFAGRLGMHYWHLPELGVPKEHRPAFAHAETRTEARSRYRREAERDAALVLEEAARVCESGVTVLVCYEREPEGCHRYPLSKLLSTMTGLEVRHL